MITLSGFSCIKLNFQDWSVTIGIVWSIKHDIRFEVLNFFLISCWIWKAGISSTLFWKIIIILFSVNVLANLQNNSLKSINNCSFYWLPYILAYKSRNFGQILSSFFLIRLIWGSQNRHFCWAEKRGEERNAGWPKVKLLIKKISLLKIL